jgi:hypothetical protein
MTTLFILSALLLAGWFVALHSLWKGPPPVAVEEPPMGIETLVQQKLGEVRDRQIATPTSRH